MSTKLFKRTKILATVGPSVFAEEKLKEMVYAGVNGFRLNFSHGTYDERDQQIATIRRYAAERGKSVAIVQDLQGPKIRLGDIQNNHYDVHAGDELILDFACAQHDGGNVLPVQYNLAEKVKVGEPVLLFDGKIEGITTEIVSKTAIKIKAENDGFIMSRKGINLPDTDMGGDIITEKDLADIEFGASRDFDFVAMSFIQCAEDVEKLRQIMVSHGSTAQIISKIETKKAVENDEVMEAIVKASDGIMVARGDLAYEAGAEIVPIVQRKLIALCRQYSKICIVATQMMGSMVDNPRPTRAEVSDVATAVLLGADAVMLSDETANGKYPIEAIKEMKKVILYTQDNSKILPIDKDTTGNYKNYDAISRAVVRLAEQIDADLIAIATKSGATAEAIAAQRPNIPMVSITSNKRVAGQLALTYANSAYVREYDDNYVIDTVQELKTNGYLKLPEGKEELTVVVVSGLRDEEGGTNQIQIRKI
ncbi:MAG: pyruvate kinase [Candidatus Saccharibacteria bacterium]|nr:pyruvate kinase [Candidatus Saccharibacteria bacterium]